MNSRDAYKLIPKPEHGWPNRVQELDGFTYRSLGGQLFGVDDPSPAEVQRLYGYWALEHATSYDQQHDWISQIGVHSAQIIGDHFNSLQRPLRVLDVACGTGIVSQSLKRHLPSGSKVMGLDLTFEMLNEAQSKPDLADMQFIQADARVLPLAPAVYDVVIGSLFINHISSPLERLQLFSNVYSGLQEGGIFILVDTMNTENTDAIANELKHTFSGSYSQLPLEHYNENAPGGFELAYHIAEK